MSANVRHLFYVACVLIPDFGWVLKPGHSANPLRRVRQFGGSLIAQWNCPCAMPPNASGRGHCNRERFWEDAYAEARLPLSLARQHNLPGEIYEVTTYILTGLRAGLNDDDEAMNRLDVLEQGNWHAAV